jgi:hypothetical protein
VVADLDLTGFTKKQRVEYLAMLNEKSRRVAMGDFEYFLDNYVFIEDKERKCELRLELWPEQRKIIPTLVQAELLELLKTRQVGLTWMCAALVLWLCLKHDLHLTIIISSTEDHAIEFMDRVYFILDRLPTWMILGKTRRTKQTFELERGKLVSVIKSMPTIEIGAESKTPNLLILDEAHTIRSVGMIFSSSLPGIEQAKGRVIVIANSVKTGPGWPWVRDNYMKSMRGDGRFERIFLPWMAHPDRPPDFRARMMSSGMSESEVIEHYPQDEQEALQSASGSFFGKSLSRHNSFVSGEEGFLLRGESGELTWMSENRGMVEVWEHPDVSYKGRYAIGSDIGEGLGGDYSVAYALDRVDGKVVARMRSNVVDADTWGYNLRDLSNYYGGATVCCERNGSGITTIKRLEELYVPQYVRILAGKTGGTIQKVYGWGQTTASKFELCGDLKTWFLNTEEDIPCGVLIDEASTFILEGSKLGAESGKHDDTVIAMALAIQADKFMGSASEIVRPVKEPDKLSLEYVAYMDRQECFKQAMQEEVGQYEW